MSHTKHLRRGFLKVVSMLLLGVVALTALAPLAEAQMYRRGGRGYYGRGYYGRGFGRGFYSYNRGYRGYGGYGYGPRVYSRGYYGYRAPVVPYLGYGGYGGYYAPVY